jgi:hypothetical protein
MWCQVVLDIAKMPVFAFARYDTFSKSSPWPSAHALLRIWMLKPLALIRRGMSPKVMEQVPALSAVDMTLFMSV